MAKLEIPQGWTQEKVDELRRLWNTSGWSEDAIAAHFGLRRTSLARWKDRLNLPKRQPFPATHVRPDDSGGK